MILTLRSFFFRFTFNVFTIISSFCFFFISFNLNLKHSFLSFSLITNAQIGFSIPEFDKKRQK